jgi:tetratricopeptide (TPR) repeat protein
MKKFFLCLICILFFTASVHASDYYLAGINSFNSGAYQKATLNLEHAIKINHKNVNARYYLAQSYLKLHRVEDAKQQYKRIILLAPSSEASRLSQKGLSLIKQSELGNTKTNLNYSNSNNSSLNDKDDYLVYVLTNDGEIFKWASFPLNVYIEPKRQKNAVKLAFEQWQKKSNNLVNFKFTDSSENAQITVDFKDKLETSTQKTSYIAGYSKPYYQGKYIIKSEIHLLSINPETKLPLNDNFITSTALHEIGHSLGFKGHSPNKDDVMYGFTSFIKINLTKRDLNTLNLFYKTDQNSLIAKTSKSPDVKLNQALDYIKKIPDKAVGWANLGDIYRDRKMYPEAIKNYQKAISIEPDKGELYELLGSTYIKTGDKSLAFTNLKKACDLEKNNSFYLYNFTKLCLEVGQKDVGKSYINDYLKENPKSYKSDDKIKKLLKLYNITNIYTNKNY